jgi:DNA topoisomerase-1
MESRSGVDAGRAAARSAGLHYVLDGETGFSRVGRPGRFFYRDARGRAIRDRKTLNRIRSLVIPPAWTDVWICARADGHVQATGRDARGRKQHRYHARWSADRNRAKYDRMADFARALPVIRRRVQADLRKPPISRAHVLAMVVRLLERTLIRIGNKEYARANQSFGLTTLQDDHVRIDGITVMFRFRAKSGVTQTVELDDPSLAKVIKAYRDVPGKALFQYFDGDGRRQCVDSAAINAYLRETTGRPFTAKNFRTWAATVLAAQAVCAPCEARSETARKRHIVQVVDRVAKKLGNTRAVCRSSYIHPGVFEAWRRGVTIESLPTRPRAANLSAHEAAVLALLRVQTRDVRPSRAAA